MTDKLSQKPLTPPIRANETERLAALHRYKILDTPPEAAFDRITRLAARLFDMPTVFISLVDESRAWFKSCVGFDGREASRDVTLCSFSVLTDKPLIIPDTRLDDRFACNPIVQGEPGVRFYAGAPLLSHDGFNLGTLCLIDTQPRDPLTAEQQATLVDLAAMVVDELELRLAAHKIAQSEEKYRTLFESIDEGFCIVEVLFEADGRAYDHRILQANPAFERHTGIPNPNGKTASELAPGLEQYWNDLYAQVVHTGETVRVENRSDALDRWFDVLVSRVGDASTCQVAIVFSDITDLKGAESNLRSVYVQLETALAAGAVYTYRWNIPDDRLVVNAAFAHLFNVDVAGATTAGLPLKLFINSIHEQDRPGVVAAIEQAIATGEVYMAEYRVQTAMGEERWVAARGQVEYDAAGSPMAFIGAIADITERKQTEAALQESESRLKLALKIGKLGSWQLDLKTNELLTFEQCKANYGFSSDADFSHQALFDRMHPEDRAWVEAAIQQAIEQYTDYDVEYRNVWDDGSIHWVLVRGCTFYDSNGTPLQMIGMSLDITDRKQAEAALLESEEQSRNILESITDAFFALNEHWRFTYVNRAAETLLDRTPGDLIGQSIWEAYLGLDGTEFEQLYWRVMRDRVVGSVTAFYPDHERWYEVHVYPASNGITIYFRNVTEQIQTAATLRQSEERYRTLFESIDEGFCVVEVLLDAHDTPYDYRVLEVNLIFEQQTGLQQAVGKTARQLNLEDHWIEIYGRVALTGESIRFENGSKTLNRWFDVYACRTGEPESRKVAIVFKDISNRKRREANLAFLANITEDFSRLSSAHEIMQTVGAKIGAYLEITTCHFTDVDEVRGEVRVHYCWNSPDVPTTVGTFRTTAYLSEEFQRASRAGETVVIRDTQTDPRTDGPSYAALNMHSFVTVPFHRDGRWTHYIAICDSRPRDWRDDELELIEELSNRIFPRLERARAEAVVAADLQDTQRLRELGARLVTEGDIQTLYQEILSTAIALTRADAGTVQILDEATQDLVLFATQGFERKMTEHFYRVNASSNTPCGIALRNGERTFVDFDVPESEDPNGSMRMHTDAGYFSGQSTPLITRSGKAIGMISTHWREHHKPSDRELRFLDLLVRQASDLIEQRQTAAEREQLLAREQAARAEADRANRIKDEFLAVLSHELRSPLNPILGWTRLLQNGKLDAARQAEALATIERNAKLQSQLIEDLLDISRIMQGKLTLTAAPVSLAFVISAAVETVSLAADAKNIQITLDLDPEVAPISGDAARLQQVVWNLVTNAVKFTNNGGQVTVELRRVDAEGGLLGNQMAQIRVIDTGKGISPQFLPHVFEYFRQEDGSTTRRFGGLGLGLAIVRQIVELHGGTVKAESQGEHQGATFIVQLPTLQQAILLVPEPIQTQADSETLLKNVQILLVDDDTDTREFQAFLLEENGAKVIAAASGLEALQVLDQLIPDVIVSDIGMAEIDGYMLMRQIRSRPPTQGGATPAIALTAYAAEIDQKRALQAGFQMHLTKPLEPEQFVSAIVSLLKSNPLHVTSLQ